MKTLKIVSIGNSKGVRIPKDYIEAYHFGSEVLCEERPEGLLLKNPDNPKLSLEETFREMAQSDEDWSDFEAIDSLLGVLK